MKEIQCIPLGGEGCIVEVDNTIVGGKAKNMCNKKRKSFKNDRDAAMANKTTMTAYIERGGKIRFDVKDKGESEPELLLKHVDTDSILMTDTANVYNKVGEGFAQHEKVDHNNNEYVREKIWHTNTIEGAFSHFDRMVIGIYHNVSRKHMQAYANECAYRYNTRKMDQPVRFEDTVLKCSGVRIKYNTLIAK